MGNEGKYVTIEVERFQELLDMETRASVLLDTLRIEGSLSTRTIFQTLGCIDEAEEIKRKDEERLQEYLKAAEDKKNEDN